MSPAVMGRPSEASISPLSSQPRMVVGDALGQAHGRRARRPPRRAATRRRRSAVIVRHLGRPHLDEAAVAHAVHAVAHDRGFGRQPRRAAAIGEHAVDCGKYRRDGAERQIERNALPGQPGVRCHRREGFAHGVELREVGALEAVDRLLLVADDEQRAHLAARARVAEELRAPAPRRSATAPGSCPAPRRRGCGRCRGRA